MQSYMVYYKNGRFIPLDKVDIPEGSRAVVTLLEETPEDISRRQREAIANFRKAIQASGSLPPVFDEVMKKRVDIKRKLDI